MKAQAVIENLCKKKSTLSEPEINHIFDFLVEMCKNAETLESNSISIGTHLLNDFYDQSK